MSTRQRVFDLVGAVCGLVVFFPVMTAVAIAVWCEDRGPVLFRQWRLGRGRHPFAILKFRSMRDGKDYDAEWGKRMRGDGPHAWQIGRRFEIATKRLGLNRERLRLRTDLFMPPGAQGEQMNLF